MKRLKIRCLGGFEVWHGERQVTGFESQKTKALLAYFLSHRDRALSRDRLAALFWPETGDDAARRNLRQAVYCLKRCLPSADAAPIVASEGALRWNRRYSCWHDVEAFEREIELGEAGDSFDPHSLATAVDFYRGDFLAGLQVRDSEEFDLWTTAERERLRDKALEALRSLVESYLARGEYRFGVRYAHRLLAIDPLAEEAYRYLMQLYALSGRRAQALAQYEELRRLLLADMSVEPMPETEALHREIAGGKISAIPAASGRDEPIGPLVPLVGRREAFRRLKEWWQADGAGEVPTVLVTGEAGVGKSRLVKSFLDSVAARGGVTVLQGRCFDQGATLYQPFPQLLKNALGADSPGAERVLRDAPADLLAELSPLVPGLAHLRPDVPSRPPPGGGPGDAAVRLFETLAGDGAAGAGAGRLAIFLDDLHLAGPETFDLLGRLRGRLEAGRVRIVAAYRDDVRPEALRRLEEDVGRAATGLRLTVERLEPSAVEEIAASLVRGEASADLGRFLIRSGEGLPIAVAEAINFLWDEGALVPGEAGRWRLARPVSGVTLPASGALRDVIVRRFYGLPSSARRLAALAAVMGQRFDTELLRTAAEELDTVVQANLELMLERWLIRRSADGWASSGRERCIVLWAQGVRRGSFEFAHELIRKAIYEELDPRRRRVMHGEVAAVLEKRYLGAATEGETAGMEVMCEVIADHFVRAGAWDQALVYLRRAADRARRLEALEVALAYDERCVLVRDSARARCPGSAPMP